MHQADFGKGGQNRLCKALDFMDTALKELISRYVTLARNLFPEVADYIGVELPISNIDWTCLSIEQRGETLGGVRYFKHGYGIAMNDGSQSIDLDIGPEGEFDGFDAWRLYQFAESNDIVIPYSDHKSLETAMTRAVNAGELQYMAGGLYFYANEI
jgi:hypothetical protein